MTHATWALPTLAAAAIAGCGSSSAIKTATAAHAPPSVTALAVTSLTTRDVRTGSRSIVLTGTASPGATVSVEPSPGSVLATHGRWRFRLTLTVGANPITVSARGPNPGDVSPAALNYVITRTQTPAQRAAAKAAAAARAAKAAKAAKAAQAAQAAQAAKAAKAAQAAKAAKAARAAQAAQAAAAAKAAAKHRLLQQNAVHAAQDYLSTSPFSKQGLIDQLSSSAGDGYSVQDATAAVDSLTVDWNAEAVKAAKDYLQTSPFSCQAMIDQLSSSAGDGYTAAQAQYGATKVGLC
jgi:ribosomal protein L3